MACNQNLHAFDSHDAVDCYREYNDTTEQWEYFDCEVQPCPNRHNSIPEELQNDRFLVTVAPPAPSPVTETMSALSPAQIMQAVASLTTAVADLTQQVNWLTSHVNGPSSSDSKSTIQKPSPYDGKTSVDACRFIAVFAMYGHSLGNKLNNAAGVRNDSLWIGTALSFLRDEAAVWATPYVEDLVAHWSPFTSWDEFVLKFKARFETQDEATDAKQALRQLWQGKMSVPEYTAWFREAMSRTGYSTSDLRDRYYEHLSIEIKDALPMTERSTKTLDKLITVVTDLDTRLRQRKAEKARETGKATGVTFTAWPTPSTSASPFAAPPKDPNAMDLDATKARGNGKSRKDFMKVMVGRCFGCGSKDHVKRDGGHERDVCSHCGRTGHRVGVCQSRFMGQPGKSVAAATADASPNSGDIQEISSPATQEATQEGSASAAASSSLGLAEIMARMREMSAELAAIKQAF